MIGAWLLVIDAKVHKTQPMVNQGFPRLCVMEIRWGLAHAGAWDELGGQWALFEIARARARPMQS
jgi:hypothetical protein